MARAMKARNLALVGIAAFAIGIAFGSQVRGMLGMPVTERDDLPSEARDYKSSIAPWTGEDGDDFDYTPSHPDESERCESISRFTSLSDEMDTWYDGSHTDSDRVDEDQDGNGANRHW